jgi:ComF family protein
MPLVATASVCGACLRHPPPLQQCIAVLDYAYPWQEVIGRYKFQSDLGLVRSLSRLLAENAEVQHLLLNCDALLPVPASDTRLRERGFDHTRLLAASLLTQSDSALPLLTRAVQRQHIAQSQHASTRAQRLRQLRGAFTLQPGQQAAIEGRRLVLLDDVMTTGATLNALADCLLHAGAASVSAVVLARTA